VGRKEKARGADDAWNSTNCLTPCSMKKRLGEVPEERIAREGGRKKL